MNKIKIEATVITESVSFKDKTQQEINELNEQARLDNESKGFIEITIED